MANECWICFEDCDEAPICKCKTMVCHKHCLAKWQSSSCKNKCDRCHDELMDWRYINCPNYDEYVSNVICTVPIVYSSEEYEYFRVTPTTTLEDLMRQVTRGRRKIHRLDFYCRLPNPKRNFIFYDEKGFDNFLFCARVYYADHLSKKNRFKQWLTQKCIIYVRPGY